MTLVEEILVFLPILLISCCVAYGIYGVFALYQYRNEMFMKKRTSVIAVNCVMIFGEFILLLLHVSASWANLTVTGVLWGTFCITWFVLFLMLNVGNWMLYFKYKW
eukprot:858186_1